MNKHYKINEFNSYLSEETYSKYRKILNLICEEIGLRLKSYPNFLGVSFTDVGAGGIQINGHHKESNYVYSHSPTLHYNFDNIKECIDDFVEAWIENDNPESVKSFNEFTKFGEEFGWD